MNLGVIHKIGSYLTKRINHVSIESASHVTMRSERRKRTWKWKGSCFKGKDLRSGCGARNIIRYSELYKPVTGIQLQRKEATNKESDKRFESPRRPLAGANSQ
jgi:hypothetical protein